MDEVMRRRLTLLAVAVAVLALPPVLGRMGLLSSEQGFVLGRGACFAAAALALNMVMGYAGQISLGHFSLLGVGAFTTGIITGADHLALPYVIAIPVSAMAGAAVAFLVGLPALRLRGLYLAIVTIGFAYAMQASVFRARAITGGSGGVEVPRPLINTFQFLRNGDYLAIVLFVLLVVWLVDVNVTRTRLGRAFQAVKASEPVAASFGVDVARHKLLAFVLSGAFAGIAGAMYAPLVGTISASSFTYNLSLVLVIVVVIGGLGSRAGVVAAAFIFAELPELLELFGEGFRGTDQVVGALGLMLAVRNHPGGFAQAMRERREKKAAPVEGSGAGIPQLSALPRPTAASVVPVHGDVLEVSNVTVRFGGITAVDGASLSVPHNTIMGLIGPNGAGKTTLFNVVSGFVTPQDGSVKLLGRDVTTLAPHARAAAGMGRTFQGIGLAKDLTVTENLLLAQHRLAEYSAGEALVGIGRTWAVERTLRERAREAVAALGFERFEETPVRLLSHGQQRIVEIGCVLVTSPELVMLDEPSAGMAPGAAEDLALRLRDIRDELGRTVLLIEHNLPLVLDVCDQLTVLATGRVIASGTVDEVARQADVVDAYLGEAVPA
ncbi:MAG TPA: branched-chain amino acid ABC transporter ATP-binding protein/permease [Acidimicrobiales bacterium]|jgi:branched-chain amino acid transport system permease protein|nr:branched-chain amino acid ABC transporter ATP-binding protein/permease [Acidimicrobiales bacterium]